MVEKNWMEEVSKARNDNFQRKVKTFERQAPLGRTRGNSPYRDGSGPYMDDCNEKPFSSFKPRKRRMPLKNEFSNADGDAVTVFLPTEEMKAAEAVVSERKAEGMGFVDRMLLRMGHPSKGFAKLVKEMRLAQKELLERKPKEEHLKALDKARELELAVDLWLREFEK